MEFIVKMVNVLKLFKFSHKFSCLKACEKSAVKIRSILFTAICEGEQIQQFYLMFKITKK